jgi:hypothetical protein
MGTPVLPEWYSHKRIARIICARECTPCFHLSKWSSFTSHFTFENFLHAAISKDSHPQERAHSWYGRPIDTLPEYQRAPLSCESAAGAPRKRNEYVRVEVAPCELLDPHADACVAAAVDLAGAAYLHGRTHACARGEHACGEVRAS